MLEGLQTQVVNCCSQSRQWMICITMMVLTYFQWVSYTPIGCPSLSMQTPQTSSTTMFSRRQSLICLRSYLMGKLWRGRSLGYMFVYIHTHSLSFSFALSLSPSLSPGLGTLKHITSKALTRERLNPPHSYGWDSEKQNTDDYNVIQILALLATMQSRPHDDVDWSQVHKIQPWVFGDVSTIPWRIKNHFCPLMFVGFFFLGLICFQWECG